HLTTRQSVRRVPYRHVHVRVSLVNQQLPTTQLYALSLHDALPISAARCRCSRPSTAPAMGGSGSSSGSRGCSTTPIPGRTTTRRSEEHTSELQSRENLVCRLLLEKTKKVFAAAAWKAACASHTTSR